MYNMNDLYKNYYDNYRQYDDVYGYINYYNMDYNRMNPYKRLWSRTICD